MTQIETILEPFDVGVRQAAFRERLAIAARQAPGRAAIEAAGLTVPPHVSAASSPYAWTSPEYPEWALGVRYGRALAQRKDA